MAKISIIYQEDGAAGIKEKSWVCLKHAIVTRLMSSHTSYIYKCYLSQILLLKWKYFWIVFKLEYPIIKEHKSTWSIIFNYENQFWNKLSMMSVVMIDKSPVTSLIWQNDCGYIYQLVVPGSYFISCICILTNMLTFATPKSISFFNQMVKFDIFVAKTEWCYVDIPKLVKVTSLMMKSADNLLISLIGCDI